MSRARPKPPSRPAQRPQRRCERDERPSKLAKSALDDDPRKSNRAIAVDVGVSRMTVGRLRRSTEPTPSAEVFDWRAEVELVVGVPRAGRSKADPQ
jgi:hypothetical protein